ncbi:MAG: insulinase family protein, partial [Clostridia bacterium]|nr:insulinase family protein [Clostridia bacterium]
KAAQKYPITADLVLKCAQGSTNVYPVHIMAALVESGITTELYGELYNELFEGGFINESYSYGYSITRDVAFHSIYGEGENPVLVLEKIKDYIKKTKQKGLCERDFIRCKRVMMAEFLRDFDSVDDIANSLLNIFFDGSNIFEYRKIIEGVTFSDVCACLENYFDDKRFALSVIKN